MTRIEELKLKLKQKTGGSQNGSVDNTEVRASAPANQTPSTEQIRSNGSTQSPGVATIADSQQILERISRLRSSLASQIPGYESILHTIHRQLSKDPELTHLLKDEDIGVIVEAMKKRKGVVLVEEARKAAGKKSLKNTGVEDL